MDPVGPRLWRRHWKCGTTTCSEEATIYANWPGQPLPFCLACAQRAEHFAQALGFTLTVIPLEFFIAKGIADAKVHDAEVRLAAEPHKSEG